MKDDRKTRLKKQMLSGAIYIALAAAVVGVTTGTVEKLINTKEISLPETDLENTKYGTALPEIPELPEIPDAAINKNSDSDAESSDGAQVSGLGDGVNAEIIPGDEMYTPEIQETAEESSENLPEQVEVSAEQTVSEPDYGYPGYVKPCGGLIVREYSPDVLVYSPTMYDYRVHTGIDIAADIGTQIKAISGGRISEVKNDDLYGTTVTIDSPDGLRISYSNLSAELPQGIETGADIQTGSVIGGVGDTAICESAQAPHLHVEAARDGNAFDPSELFTDAEAKETAAAATSEETD